ncbi:exosome complex component RRP4 [Trichogramma pretiosum]|uniref:Ribosomal RNA-processing protein 4 n=1 Tax=Trichogramma kaykai TaxID=54128 RepID=A0ABD2XG17_9HYME|nr:exosome complex component RRP4 [Trichogramma pretiosum]
MSYTEENGESKILVRLANNRIDHTLPVQQDPRTAFYTPGEEISTQPDFLRGHGTYMDTQQVLRASVAGNLERVNKLISVRPYKTRYQGEIGDVVIGRITEVQQKRWKVDTNAKLDSALLLSSVNLPGGELRRRSAEDEQAMRRYLQEGDVVCAEVQSIFADGSLSLHTRVLKYGKLSQGIMMKLSPSMIKRQKQHFHNLANGAVLILGNNGNVWIGASQSGQDSSQGGFTQDYSRIDQENREVCARLQNCIRCLVKSNILLSDTSVTYAYEESMKYEIKELIQDEVQFNVALLTHQRLVA